MHFIFVPIVKKYSGILEILLNLSCLWSPEDLSQIIQFLKQAKWIEGLSIFFESNSVKQYFVQLGIMERF